MLYKETQVIKHYARLQPHSTLNHSNTEVTERQITNQNISEFMKHETVENTYPISYGTPMPPEGCCVNVLKLCHLPLCRRVGRPFLYPIQHVSCMLPLQWSSTISRSDETEYDLFFSWLFTTEGIFSSISCVTNEATSTNWSASCSTRVQGRVGNNQGEACWISIATFHAVR